MSGRTFGMQSSWDDTLKKLTSGLGVDGPQLRQAIGMADSMNQQLEEFINRSVVTYINDSGDVTIGGALLSASLNVTGDVGIGTAAGGWELGPWPTNGDYMSLRVGDMAEDADYALICGTGSSASTYLGSATGGTTYIRGPANSSTAQLSVSGTVSSFTGSVGIGTASPAYPLDVHTDARIKGILRVGVSGSEGDSQILFYDDDGGTERTFSWDVNESRFYFEGDIAPSGSIHGPVGSAGSPTYSFSGDTNTGMYRDAADSLSFATGGTQRLDIDSGGIKGKLAFQGPAGTAAAPSFSIDGDTNTGMYRVTSDQLGFSTGGALRGRFYSGGLLMGGSSTGAAQIRSEVGTAAAPNYTFYGDSNTGMYRSTTDTIGFSTGGALRAYINSAGIYLSSGDWFRSQGSAGWYAQSYGGGWYMTDNTYMRLYGSKQLYSPNLVRTDSTNAFRMPNATGTGSYNTVRYRTSDGQMMPYTSTAVSKANITEMKGLLEYLNERSLLYSLRPVIFTEADDRVDRDGLPVKTSRDEYTHGMVAEEVLEVAPELAYFDYDGELTSYAPDLFVPDIIAELQRLMPMVEALYSAANADWVAPAPRTEASSMFERGKYDDAAAAQALIGFDDISDPIPNRAELDDL